MAAYSCHAHVNGGASLSCLAMFRFTAQNRPRHWYSFLRVGQRNLLLLAGFMVALMLFLLSVVVVYTIRAGAFEMEQVIREPNTSVLFDTKRQAIGSLGIEERRNVTWQELPQHLTNAFLAREDAHFFEHKGLVYSSIFRSILRNVSSMSYEQGASTISMQLARNVYDLREKSLDRKLLELFLTQRIEKNYDKETIFTQYLNRIYFGQNCYGIADAARRYFGKEVSQLSLVESATLAGLIRGPSIFNPVTSMESAMSVKSETLGRMLEHQFITHEEYDAAVAAPIILSSQSARIATTSYPTMRANEELKKINYILDDSSSGVYVLSSLQLPIQQHVEEASEIAMELIEGTRDSVPKSWLPQLGSTPAQQQGELKRIFRLKRPAALKKREGEELPAAAVQCAVLVVSSQPGQQGNILALSCGRSVIDGRDRWEASVRPGRVLAPLLFSAACQPGGESFHIVSTDMRLTGRRMGYEWVKRFYDKLNLQAELPSKARADDLYTANFDMPLSQVARILYSLLHDGRDYHLSLIKAIYTLNRNSIYTYKPEDAKEIIRREAALAVQPIAPFKRLDGQPISLHVTMPDDDGQLTLISNPRGITVFVWVGFDSPQEGVSNQQTLRQLIAQCSLMLAKEIHQFARTSIAESNKRGESTSEPKKK